MCNEHNSIWYEAFKRKDARFDGQFFVGVKSTGVYCRPVCKARLPRPENYTFYVSAAQAEQAGFVPACCAALNLRREWHRWTLQPIWLIKQPEK